MSKNEREVYNMQLKIDEQSKDIAELEKLNAQLRFDRQALSSKIINHRNVLTQRKMKLEAELKDIENQLIALMFGLENVSEAYKTNSKNVWNKE